MNKSSTGTYCLLTAIFILALSVRAFNLRMNPGWYVDEGCILNIASNLLKGRLQLFAVPYYLFPRLPLFPAVAALFIRMIGTDILAVRIPSIIFGSATGLILYMAAKELYGRAAGFLAFFLLAVYPFAILSSKFGSPFNLMAFLGILAYYLCLRYLKERKTAWLIAASLAAGAAALTELFGLAIVAALLFTVLLTDRRRLPAAALISISLPAAFFIIMSLAFRDAFFSQVSNFVILRIINPNPLYKTIGIRGLVNIRELVGGFFATITYGGLWTVLGSAGIIFLGRSREEKILSISVFSLLLFSVLLAFGGSSGRFVIVLIPFMILGISAIASRIRTAPALALAAILIASSAGDYPNIVNYMSRHVVMYPKDAVSAAEYLNGNIAGDGFVITLAELSWLVNAEVAEPIDVAAYMNRSLSFPFREIYPRGKFSFDASLNNAEYAMLNRFVSGFYSFFPGVVEIELEIRKTWKEDYLNGSYVVYRNPRRI